MTQKTPIIPTHHVPSDPGTIWTLDEHITIDHNWPQTSHWALTPNVVRIPNVGYRMFFTACSKHDHADGRLGNIWSASSGDGFKWLPDPMPRIPYTDDALWVLSPDVIALPAGGYRMYFQMRRSSGPDVLMIAHSDNTMTWEIESEIDLAQGRLSLGSPRVIMTPDGKWRLYTHRFDKQNPNAGTQIISALSNDGLSFTLEPGERLVPEHKNETLALYAAEILFCQDSKQYRLYYAGWGSSPTSGSLFTATSTDGLTWQKQQDAIITNGHAFAEQKASEPCVYQLPDGRFRLLYEACDQHGSWRILGATAH